MENELTLSEQLLLLAIRPEKGGISGWAYRTLDFSLIGAVLLDLSLLKKVEIKNKRVVVLQKDTGEEPYLHVLEKLSRSAKPRRITTWMGSWYISKKHIKRELYRALVLKRAVKLEERRFLFFRWKKPFLTSGGPAYRTVDQIKKIINQGAESPADIYLLFLVEVCGLMRRIYPDRFQRQKAKEKIRQIKEGNRMQEHVRQALETANAIRSAVNASAAAAAASQA